MEDPMDTDTSSTRLTSHESVSGGCVPVVVDLGSRKLKKATISFWNIAKPRPEKPSSFTEAVVMQKPSFEGAVKALVRKLVLLTEVENVKDTIKLLDLDGVQYND
eukprot:9427260-Ditylum_brightwellii.AAC.1